MNFSWKDKVEPILVDPVLGFGAWEFNPRIGAFVFDTTAWSAFGVEPNSDADYLAAMVMLFGPHQIQSLTNHWSKVTASDSVFRLKSSPTGKAARFFSMRGGLRDGKISGLIWDSTLENQKVSLALEGSGFGVWKFNPTTAALTWDEKMYEIYGHTRETFDEQPNTWTSTLFEEDRPLVAQRFGDLLNGQTVEIFEFRIVRHYDKAIRYIEGNGSSLTDPTGKVLLVVGMNRDITERKLEHERLEQQRVMLASTSKMAELGAMAAGIAHEINNPLAILVGKTELLRRKTESKSLDMATLASDFDLLFTVSNRIAEIVRSLRTYSRNADSDPKTNVRIQEILRDTLRLCVDRFKSSKINVDLDLGEFEKVQILCRPTQISQVFLNLLSNAADAIEGLEEKKISIRASMKSNWLRIIFEDSGGGVPPEIAAKIFDPFYTTKQPGKGTGLGLSISKSIIETHGGQIILVQNPNGARFEVEFPVSDFEFQNQRSSAAVSDADNALGANEVEAKALSGKRILVVDDEKEIQNILSEELRERGAIVTCASAAEEALRIFSKEKFDALITDYAMPGGDGLSLIRKLNEQRLGSRPTVFLCTAFNVCTPEMARELKISSIFAKPFRINAICHTIAEALSQKY